MAMRRIHSVSFAMKKKMEADQAADVAKDGEGDDITGSTLGAFEKKRGDVSQELLRGASRGDLRRVQRALGDRADVMQRNDRGITSLMLAAASSGSDAVEVLRELLKRKASLEEEPDNIGWTAFHHACRNGKTEAVRFLMGSSADPTLATKDGKTSLILATVDGSMDLLSCLLEIKAIKSMVTGKDALGATALHYAVKEGVLDVVKILIEKNSRVNAKDSDGRQALMLACQYGHIECVRCLHKKSAETNGQDKNKRSPLMYAVLFNREAIALFLYGKCKADPHLEDSNQDKPIDVASDQGMIQFRNAINRNRTQEQD